jgi:hypothetical protein
MNFENRTWMKYLNSTIQSKSSTKNNLSNHDIKTSTMVNPASTITSPTQPVQIHLTIHTPPHPSQTTNNSTPIVPTTISSKTPLIYQDENQQNSRKQKKKKSQKQSDIELVTLNNPINLSHTNRDHKHLLYSPQLHDQEKMQPYQQRNGKKEISSKPIPPPPKTPPIPPPLHIPPPLGSTYSSPPSHILYQTPPRSTTRFLNTPPATKTTVTSTSSTTELQAFSSPQREQQVQHYLSTIQQLQQSRRSPWMVHQHRSGRYYYFNIQ